MARWYARAWRRTFGLTVQFKSYAARYAPVIVAVVGFLVLAGSYYALMPLQTALAPVFAAEGKLEGLAGIL